MKSSSFRGIPGKASQVFFLPSLRVSPQCTGVILEAFFVPNHLLGCARIHDTGGGIRVCFLVLLERNGQIND